MKKIFIAFTMMLALAFTTNNVKAQITSEEVLQAAQGLVTVQVGAVNVNLVDVVDVSNVLNNADIDILNNFLNNLTIDNVLNNLLRDANIITGNQIVVGILSDQTTFYVADRKLFEQGNKKPKK